MRAWVADALVVLGLLVMTVGLVGLVRLPTVLMRVHASGKAAALGIVPLAGAAVVADPSQSAGAAILVVAFVVLTAPVSSHIIARAAHLEDARQRRDEAAAEGHEAG